jgi:hypothetical protein
MLDQRLNDLCLLAIQRELKGDLLINPSSVINKFWVLVAVTGVLLLIIAIQVLSLVSVLVVLDSHLIKRFLLKNLCV